MDFGIGRTAQPPKALDGAAPMLTANGPPGPDDLDLDDSHSAVGGREEPTVLRVLVTERHWQKFASFERQFRRAARELAEQQGEPELAKVTVSPRQFERWYAGKVKTTPHPDACRVLEFMFNLPVAELLAPASAAGGAANCVFGSEEAPGLTQWLTATAVSDEVIEGLDRAALRVAESHAMSAPVVVLAAARQAQAGVQAVLRTGRTRHRQTRELLRINGNLLAHIGLLLSDLGSDAGGEEYGNAALAYLREAAASEAEAWYVLAKTARWRHQYARAADLARVGLDHAAPGPMRAQLACYQANAAALAGDVPGAVAAMRLAEETYAALPAGQISLSPWSFPEERMTIFRISVALGTGHPDEALQAAAAGNPSPASGQPHVTAAWAQIRTAAAIARIRTGAVDGAAAEVTPVLALPPKWRIATVIGWLNELHRCLSAEGYAGSPGTTALLEQIRCFTTEAATRAGTS